jgi:hypothetical protein
MKIASATVFYNDKRSLRRTLDSLTDKVDYMICVDGKYKHFDDGNVSGLSTDGSRELVHEYDNALLYDKPNCFEIEKRQEYLDICSYWYDICKDPDFLLIIDSDEYIAEYDEVAFKGALSDLINAVGKYQTYNVYGIMLEVNSGKYDHIVHEFVNGQKPQVSNQDNRQYQHSPRLWFKPWEMEYNMRHYNFRPKDPDNPMHKFENCAAAAIIPGMKINHDHALRTPEHLRDRYKYQKWLVEFEQEKLKTVKKILGKAPKIEDYDKIDRP